MIISENKQGSDDWVIDRLAIPTASNFSKIITTTGKPSATTKTYMNTLLAEWYTGAPVDQIESTIWMERGNELEASARSLYEFVQNKEIKQVGVCYLDDKKLISCSPDGLVGDDGLLEIKCPKANTMIDYMLDGGFPSKYKQQVQGQMWITGRQWCDFFAYHPDFPEFLVKVNRDQKYINILSEYIIKFVDQMLIKRGKIKKTQGRG